MKVAIFGGTGFLGYDFIRLALAEAKLTPIVFSSNPKSLTNVARHGIDIRLYRSGDPESIRLESDVNLVVNFAHPFEARDRISGKEQIRRFVRFIGSAKRLNPSLRLIHLSSMSVYEPFAESVYFDEASPLAPPKDDRYANEKVYAETALLQLPAAAEWQLHLRPTVVYGAYCGVWTDRILAAFQNGDVGFFSLDGKIQPIHGEDVSRLIHENAIRFRAGVYNLPGPDVMTWKDFVTVFRDIVDVGRLVKMEGNPAGGNGGRESAFQFYLKNFRELMHVVRKEPSFDRMAVRVASRLPGQIVERIKRILLGREDSMGASGTALASTPSAALFGRAFFAADRLVSDRKLSTDFPEFRSTSLATNVDRLASYYRFRFTDEMT